MPKISLGTLYKIKQYKTQTWRFVEKTSKMDAWKYSHEDADICKKNYQFLITPYYCFEQL